MRHPSKTLSRIATAGMVALALTGTLIGGATTAQASTNTAEAAAAAADFYQAPSSFPAKNGDLIRQQPSSFFLDPLKLVSSGANVTRVMYKSTNNQGQPIGVTGTVLMPQGRWIGIGARPLVTVAPGTQGQGDSCAPSKLLALGQEYEGILVKGLLARGYAVAITDYEGLGTEGVHTYLARQSQGSAVLDMARAALNLNIPGLSASTRVAITGYSQGGGAAASAAEMAASYAPELKLIGTYAGAVPADLQAVASNIDGGLYTGFLLYAVNGLAAAEGFNIADYANPKGLSTLAKTAQECIFTTLPSAAFLKTGTLTTSGQKLSQLTTSGPLKSVLDKQKLGVVGKPSAPVMVGQSLLDDVIPAAQAKEFAKRWCAKGSTVEWTNTLVPTHVGGYAALLPKMFGFLEGRVAGLRATNNCWAI